MSIYEAFKRECAAEIDAMGSDADLVASSRAWMDKANQRKYSYHFEWMGRPIIQYPQDVLALQEIVWNVKPDLIIETGVAHGGSLVLSASLLELNALSGGPADARVVGIDIDIRTHNRAAIEAHPMSRRISLIEGSSVAPEVLAQVRPIVEASRNVLVILDSNHTHAHVAAELKLYAPFVSLGSYCIVFDTVIEDLPQDAFPDRPWGRGDNPKTAVHEFLKGRQGFVIDEAIHNKLLITVAPDGYLKRIA